MSSNPSHGSNGEAPPASAAVPKKRVLILCTGNTARSQMAEALWRRHGGERWESFSAGTSPKGYVNPLAIAVMGEIGIDISTQRSKAPDEFVDQTFDLVITVCDNAERECPTFRNARRRLHWPFDDPARFSGSEEEKLAKTRRVRDDISSKIRGYLERDVQQAAVK